MVKTNKEQLHKDESAVLTELQKHSTKNIEAISHQCGFSRQKVWRIIKKLEEKKIIWGYTTICDEERQGLEKFLMLIKRTMQAVDDAIVKNIVSDSLAKEYHDMGITIESSYYTHGEFDWVMLFTAKDLKHAKKFGNLLSSRYAGIVERITLIQVLYTQRNHHIPNPDFKKIKEFL
jgi:DNA-binding Lrp family transcriptional regulator